MLLLPQHVGLMQAYFERQLHTDEVAELQIACAVARVSVQMLCSQCSRPHCMPMHGATDMLETLFAADLRRSLPTKWSLGIPSLKLMNDIVLCCHTDHIGPQHSFLGESNLYCLSIYLVWTDSGGHHGGRGYLRQYAAGILLENSR